MERRTFLETTMAATLASGGLAATRLPRRPYKDGVSLSVIGFGGIIVVGMEQAQANRTVARAWEKGVNYYDVAPSYWDGEAERKLGPALKPFRKDAFLACKTTRRDAQGAREELEESLRRLQTERFDLYQFHAVTTKEDVEKILGPGGAAETFAKAKKEGKIRYLGASAHNMDAAIALMDAFPLDSVLFPVNFGLYAREDFGPRLLQHAKAKNVARLALKALCKEALEKGAPRVHPKCWYVPIEDRAMAARALRFTLSEDITAAIPPGVSEIFDMAVELAIAFQPLSSKERADLLAEGKKMRPIFRRT